MHSMLLYGGNPTGGAAAAAAEGTSTKMATAAGAAAAAAGSHGHLPIQECINLLHKLELSFKA